MSVQACERHPFSMMSVRLVTYQINVQAKVRGQWQEFCSGPINKEFGLNKDTCKSQVRSGLEGAARPRTKLEQEVWRIVFLYEKYRLSCLTDIFKVDGLYFLSSGVYGEETQHAHLCDLCPGLPSSLIPAPSLS